MAVIEKTNTILFEKLLEERVRNRVDQVMRGLGFSYVTMDLRGYRTGSMNETFRVQHPERDPFGG